MVSLFSLYAWAVTARQRRFLDRVVAALEASEVETPSELELARSLGVPVQAVEEIVRLGRSEGDVLALGGGVLYSRAQALEIGSRLGRQLEGKVFTIREFRETLGTNRKYADALLGWFEANGVVERTDEGRRWRGQP